ncbi:MAG TPA: fatty acid desaturase [Lacipirellulaceae bacterium]|nr:fatty acid desaturase [Lacipirellulaceae bacterium]
MSGVLTAPSATDLPAPAVPSPASSGEFSLAEARRIVGEYFRPNPWIYWTDFLASWTLGTLCFAFVRRPEAISANAVWHWPITVALFVASSLLFYRCSLFIHELVHIRADQFTAFRFAWNLLCGIPFLIPSFVYYTHIDHHRRKHYGTKEDGEYIPLATMPTWQILFYLSQVLVIPLLAIVRWGVLTPLTWVSPTVRDWVHRHASSMIMDPKYVRPLPTRKALRMIRFQEFCCFAFVWAVVARLTMSYGIFFDEPLSPMFLVQAYATGVFIVAINALRTLGAHRWTHDGSREMTFVEQMLDSVNYPYRPLIGGLWAPIGLRFHALHHIFPTMPYHALATAHQRLMRELPPDSPYRQTEARSLTEVIATLWKRAQASQQAPG